MSYQIDHSLHCIHGLVDFKDGPLINRVAHIFEDVGYFLPDVNFVLPKHTSKSDHKLGLGHHLPHLRSGPCADIRCNPAGLSADGLLLVFVELYQQIQHSALQDLLGVQLIPDGDITHDTQGRDKDEDFGIPLADLDEIWHKIGDLYQFLDARFLSFLAVIGNSPKTVAELVII